MADGPTPADGASRRGWAGGQRPLHPPVVHTAIGGVVVASVCDVVSVAGGEDQPWARTWFKGGSYALIVGTAILFVALATGLVERNRRTQRATRSRRAVNRHAVVTSLMGAVCVADLILRNNHYSDARHTPIAVLVLTLAALVLAVIGGELGGRLVYRRGLAVGPATGPEAFPPGEGAADPSAHTGELASGAGERG